MADEALTWRISSLCGTNGGNCVEVADLGSGRALRDSKDPSGPVLRFTAGEWAAFTKRIRAGEFD